MTSPILDNTINPTSSREMCRARDEIDSGVNLNPSTTLESLAPSAPSTFISSPATGPDNVEEGINSQIKVPVTISGYVWLCNSRDLKGWKNMVLYPAVNIRKIQ